MSHATVKSEVKCDKGQFTAYGAASASKDEKLLDSLLELAETRAIARALRFAGYGVEYTGVEEIGDTKGEALPKAKTPSPRNFTDQQPSQLDGATLPQIHAIEKIAKVKHWNPVECCRRILKTTHIQEIQDITKEQAITVLGKMKAAA
jgi:hypothetical protein